MQAAQSDIRTTPQPRCYLCGTEGQLLYRDLVDSYFDAPGAWNFRQCPKETCALIWLDPRPLAEDLHLAYRRYFTHGEGDGKISIAGRLRAILYQCYQAGSRVPQAMTGLGRSKLRMDQMFLHDIQPGKLLDVGCGDGLFLNRMRQLGWGVDGVDFDAKAIENAKRRYGLNLRHGDLRGVPFPENTFDAVTMSHVIEHVPDPIAVLAEVRRIVKPGGRVVLTTPNSSSIGHRRFQSAWLGLDPPRHLHVFGFPSLEELARRAGLKILSLSSTAANADIFIGGSYSIESSSDRRTSHQPPPNAGRLLKTVWAQYREHFSLDAHPAWGEEAVLVGVKPDGKS